MLGTQQDSGKRKGKEVPVWKEWQLRMEIGKKNQHRIIESGYLHHNDDLERIPDGKTPGQKRRGTEKKRQ